MELSAKLQDAINKHINAEFYSAYLYLSMAAYFEATNLRGFAHWMRVQHDEEVAHALKLFDFVNDRNGRVALQSISQPPIDFTSALEVMQHTLKHERQVTSMIDQLYNLAHSEKDNATHVLLEWFFEEQVEEEKAVSDLIEQLKLVGDDGTGMLMLDARLGERGPDENGS